MFMPVWDILPLFYPENDHKVVDHSYLCFVYSFNTPTHTYSDIYKLRKPTEKKIAG